MSESEKFVKIWHERQLRKKSSLRLTEKLKNEKTEKRREDERSDQGLERSSDKDYEELEPKEIKRENKHLRTQRVAKKVLKHSGTFIFLLSLLSTIIILLPFLGIGTKKPKIESVNVPTIKIQSEDVEAKVIREAESIGLDARFSLYVPKINAKSKVLENIDLNKASEYLAALKKGVAHGKGTDFPGNGNNIFLFSHSVSAPEYISAYNAVFYDLKLLEQGDEIIIYFSGVKYVYKVTEKIIVSPREVDFLTKDYGGETLILQTCDPPGTTLRRLLVIAKLSE